MDERFIDRIAAELNLPATKVSATARLLGESATVPFIARYRKEVTAVWMRWRSRPSETDWLN
jgi:uncharacterized protein